MNITSLIKLTAEDIGVTKVETTAVLTAALKIICGAVANGEAVQLPDFGTFYSRHREDRNQRNPQAGDPIDDVVVVKFLPAEAFRKAVNHRS